MVNDEVVRRVDPAAASCLLPKMGLTDGGLVRGFPCQWIEAQGGRNGRPRPRAERISADPSMPVQPLRARQRPIALARPELLRQWRAVIPPGYEAVRALQAPDAGAPRRVRVLWPEGGSVAVGVEGGGYNGAALRGLSGPDAVLRVFLGWPVGRPPIPRGPLVVWGVGSLPAPASLSLRGA